MPHLQLRTALPRPFVALCALLCAAQASYAVTNFTWTGSVNSLFSTAGNWVQDQPAANTPAVRAPSAANGDDATFFQGGVANRTVDIGATRRNVRGITFNSVAGANGFTFVVNGAAATSTAYGINLRPDGIINNDDDNQQFNVPIQFFTYAGGGPNAATLFPITAAAGDLTFSGTFASGSTAKETIIMSGGTMVVDGAFNVTIGTTGSGLVTGTGSLITKNGAGTLTLGGTAANTFTGGTTVNNGSVVAAKVNALGSGAYVTVNAGILNIGTFNQTIGALTNAGGTINGSGTITASSITLSGGTVNAVLGGTGGLTKQGVGTATLTAANLFSGNTSIKEGTLTLTGSGAIANSPNITIDPGATLDVSGVTGTFTLGASQTLKGGGNVTGNVIANGTVSPGASIGTLTFSAALTLSGTTTMEIDRGAAPNADLISAASITEGGTLNVLNIGAPLQLGDTFDLFNGTLSGTFTTVNLPILSDSSWGWDTSDLPVGGSITIVAVPEPSSVTLSLLGGFGLMVFILRRRK